MQAKRKLSALPARRDASPRAPSRAKLQGLTPDGRVLVELAGRSIPAAIAVSATEAELVDAVRRQGDVLVVFIDDDLLQPAIVGLLRDRVTLDGSAEKRPIERAIDLEATSMIRLSAGEASIQLSASGRVEIRGIEVVSIAEGTNQISGGAVRLN